MGKALGWGAATATRTTSRGTTCRRSTCRWRSAATATTNRRTPRRARDRGVEGACARRQRQERREKKRATRCQLRGDAARDQRERRKPVKMEALRAWFEALGFKHVRTYVQSGNVVFDAQERAAAALARRSWSRSSATSDSTYRCWSSAPTSSRGWSTRIRSSRSRIDPTRLHVTFLAGAPATVGLKKMERVSSGRDAFAAAAARPSTSSAPTATARPNSRTTPSSARPLARPRDDPQLEDGHHAGGDGVERAGARLRLEQAGWTTGGADG